MKGFVRLLASALREIFDEAAYVVFWTAEN